MSHTKNIQHGVRNYRIHVNIDGSLSITSITVSQEAIKNNNVLIYSICIEDFLLNRTLNSIV